MPTRLFDANPRQIKALWGLAVFLAILFLSLFLQTA